MRSTRSASTTAPGTLLELPNVAARSTVADSELGRVDALDRLLREELRRLGLVELRRAAGALFGIGRGGTTLNALIRLAGWTGEVTKEETRELRFALARVGEWDREGFATCAMRSPSRPPKPA